MLSIDKINTDDSYFQVGLTEKEKDFINFKNTNIAGSRSLYVDSDINNEPLYIIYFGIDTLGNHSER